MSCPICQKDAAQKFRPFCSARCADIDLGRWMTGAYAVPTYEDPDTDHDLPHNMPHEGHDHPSSEPRNEPPVDVSRDKKLH